MMTLTDDATMVNPETPTLTLADWIEGEAASYDGLNHEYGRLVATILRDLAATVRYTGARTVAEFTARVAVLDDLD